MCQERVDGISPDRFRFFLKGGNAIPLLTETRRPFSFTGDFDCEVLIDPSLAKADFLRVYFRLLERIIKEVQTSVSTTSYYDDIWKELQRNNYRPVSHYENTIKVFGTSTANEDLFTSALVRDFRMPDKSPFLISIIPNFVWKGTRIGLAILRVQTRTEPRVTLLDITLPRPDYEHLSFVWNTYNYNLFNVGMYTFYVLDPVSQYVDLRFAAAQNERPEWKAKRTRRANRIRNTIVRPKKNTTLKNSISRISRVNYRINGKTLKNMMSEL